MQLEECEKMQLEECEKMLFKKKENLLNQRYLGKYLQADECYCEKNKLHLYT